MILRLEEFGVSIVIIVNLFLLFVLFMDKFVVYFFIGFVGDCRILNRKLIGLKKGKKLVGKFCCNLKYVKLKMKNKVLE